MQLMMSDKCVVSLTYRVLVWAMGMLLLVSLIFRELVLEIAGASQGTNPVAKPQKERLIPKVEFVDMAARAGLSSFRHVSGPMDNKEYIVESTGSGVALLDYNKDGLLDILLVNGITREGFPKGQEPTNHLYQNNGDGTFKDVTEQANLVHSGWGQGVCVGDYDNDGNDDLFVTYYGQNALYRNRGNGSFEDVTEKAGLLQKGLRYNTGCAFLDYDKDGKLDLFVANYVRLDLARTLPKSSEKCVWKGIAVYCGPQGLPGGVNLLYHNNGDGTFTDVSEKSGITNTGVCYGFTALVFDLDNDGWPDIYVVCDSTANILYHNEHNGTFAEVALISGTAYNKDGKEQGGMGAAAADYDGDGFFDIVKTNFDSDTPTLYHNNGDGTFLDFTLPAGLGLYTSYLGWGTGFADIDNDGWKDIIMVNGHVYPEVDRHKLDRSYQQRRLVYYNLRDGTFRDISTQAGPAISERHSSRGAALGDLDNDGSLEIVVNNMSDTPSLLKNLGERKNWILVKLIGTESNRDGIGARVTLFAGKNRQMDEVRSGGSYISQNDFRLHFGLGESSRVDLIEIRWPSGRNESFQNLQANQVVILEEGKGTKIEGMTGSKR